MSKRYEIEIIARGVLRRGSWVLACKNLAGGYWYLPGGHVEFGEAAAGALARELVEEADLRVKVGPLLLASEDVFSTKKRPHHEINLLFHVEQRNARREISMTSPPLVHSREEHIGFDWLDIRQLPSLDLRPRAVRNWLLRWYKAGASTRSSTWNTAMKPGIRRDQEG